MRLRPLLANLLLAALSLALGAAALEWGARLLVSRRGPAPGPARPISRHHPTLGWDKPPGGEMRIAREEYDVTIRVNSRGLRGPERGYEKPAGTRRVLILGDSFAEGYYVEEEDSARARLEAALAEAPDCGRWEVLNGATAGWSTDQEYLFYSQEGRRYAPDLVVVFLYYNDLYYNTTGIGTGGKPKPYFEEVAGQLALRNVPVPRREDEDRVAGLRPWRGSLALRLLSDRTLNGAPGLHRALAAVGLAEPVSSEPFREFWPYGLAHRDEVESMWRRTALILRDLRQAVAADGGRLAVFYVPSRLEVNDDARRLTEERYKIGLGKTRDRIANRLRRTCEILGVPLLDPRSELRQAEASGAPAYFPNDGHWNERGNQIVAEALGGFVRSEWPCVGPARAAAGAEPAAQSREK